MVIRLDVVLPDGSAAGSTPGPYHYRFDREEVLIGRSERVDVCLPHPAVSLVHARLLYKEQRLLLIDMGSTNGLFCEGARVPAGHALPVGPGSAFRVGPFELRLVDPRDDRGDAPRDTSSYAREMVLGLLEVIDGQHQERRIELAEADGSSALHPLPATGVVVIGRGRECEIALDDGDASRQHAELRCEPDAIWLRDLGSKNGTLVNGVRAETRTELHDGDELHVGRTRLTFRDPAAAMLAKLQRPDELDGRDDASGSSASDPGLPAIAGSIDTSWRWTADGGDGAPGELDSQREAGPPSSAAPDDGRVRPARRTAPPAEPPPAGATSGRTLDLVLLGVGVALVVAAGVGIAYLIL